MTQTTISSIDAKLEYIVEIMVRMAEYEEKSIKEFRSDLGEIKESSKRLDQKLDRVEAIIENNAIESREESRLFNEKMDRFAAESREESRLFNEKMDRFAAESREESRLFNEKMDRFAAESREESRLFNEKMDHLSEQVILVNETSKRQEHHIDRLVGIVETLVKVEAVAKNAG
jgi:hypothetical protein